MKQADLDRIKEKVQHDPKTARWFEVQTLLNEIDLLSTRLPNLEAYVVGFGIAMIFLVISFFLGYALGKYAVCGGLS